MTLTVAPGKRFLEQSGQPFFYLADTVWSAFTGPTDEEWDYYLDVRQRQGFTALQISILPIEHDASTPANVQHPYARATNGTWDFSAFSDAYFSRAATLVQAARQSGFVPALVLLWCSYVPGTWASKRDNSAVMPFEAVRGYLERVATTFAPFDPLYIVSGDTDFDGPEALRYYAFALETVKQLCPRSLTTMHLSPVADLPPQLVEAASLDFYMYQSGHHIEESERPYALAEHFASKPVRRPVINGEPCYEGHGHGFRYGRFSAFDVRRAIWQSLLSGAGAGVAYGAHGVWSWHRRDAAFTSAEFSMIPFPWQDALSLPGAWDAGLARAIFERYALFDLESRQDLLADAPPAIRAAASPAGERVAIYVPFPTALTLNIQHDLYEWTAMDLAERRAVTLPITSDDGRTAVGVHAANADVLLIGSRR